MTEVTIYYLEMNAPEQHRRKAESKGMIVQEAQIKQGKVNRFLYDLIGEDWQWDDRQDWTSETWIDYAESEQLRTWIAYVDGSIAGYFELKRLDNALTEIAYFGLAPKFVGRGFGGFFLSQAIDNAWRWGDTRRVILNTCTFDHPSALANYKARGFSVYDEVTRNVQG